MAIFFFHSFPILLRNHFSFISTICFVEVKINKFKIYLIDQDMGLAILYSVSKLETCLLAKPGCSSDRC